MTHRVDIVLLMPGIRSLAPNHKIAIYGDWLRFDNDGDSRYLEVKKLERMAEEDNYNGISAEVRSLIGNSHV